MYERGVIMENKTIKDLCERRSVRSYSRRQVDEAALSEILRAGTFAPTGMNRQSPIMIVVQDKALRERLRAMNARIIGNPDSDPFYGAPTIIVVLADRSIPTCVEDASLVMGNLLNAAHAMGVDSCWIHRAKEEFDSPEGKEILKEFGICGDYIGVGHCILGYRAEGTEAPVTRPRKENYIYRK